MRSISAPFLSFPTHKRGTIIAVPFSDNCSPPIKQPFNFQSTPSLLHRTSLALKLQCRIEPLTSTNHCVSPFCRVTRQHKHNVNAIQCSIILCNGETSSNSPHLDHKNRPEAIKLALEARKYLSQENVHYDFGAEPYFVFDESGAACCVESASEVASPSPSVSDFGSAGSTSGRSGPNCNIIKAPRFAAAPAGNDCF